MFRILTILAILVVVIAVGVAAAAGLTVNGGVIQGGEDSDLTCDTDGVDVVAYGLNTYPTDEGVEYITVSGIPAACDGARILGRLYTPGFSGGDYVYTSGVNQYGVGEYFVIASGNSATEYKLYLKESDYTTPVWVPAEYILNVKLWLEGETP